MSALRSNELRVLMMVDDGRAKLRQGCKVLVDEPAQAERANTGQLRATARWKTDLDAE
jgi:hypothetical protein